LTKDKGKNRGINKELACLAAFASGLLLLAGGFVIAEQSKTGAFASAEFSKSRLCSTCHGNIFGQWDGSMHSKANEDFFYQAMLQEYVKAAENESLPQTFCSRCHTPIGVVSEELPPMDGSKLSEVSKEGVQCDFCHVVVESEGIGNAPYILEPGNTKWGRALETSGKKRASAHEIKGYELYEEARYCGMCHNIYHPENNLTLAATYTEWNESSYAEAGVSCQACHMTPGIIGFAANPGKAASNGPEREHIYTHFFVGANAFVTAVLGESRHEKRALEFLKQAASLSVRAPETAKAGERVDVEVEITNSGAGHMLPTGVTEERELWLELRVKDAEGRVLYHSGSLDEKGRLEPETTVYRTVFADSEGKPTKKIWEAESLLSDNRISPKASVLEKHSFIMPESALNPIRVEASLYYRSASQEHIDSLFGKGSYTVPVIEMAAYPEAEKTSIPGFGALEGLGAVLGLLYLRLSNWKKEDEKSRKK